MLPSSLPNAPLNAFEVSSGFSSLLEILQGDSRGLLLSKEASEALGVKAGKSLVLEQGHGTVHAVYDWPDDGRRGGFGYAALLPVPSEIAFDECWVNAWPHPKQLADLLLNTRLQTPEGSSEDKPTISQLNSTLGTTFDGQARYDSRPTRFAPLLSFVTAFLVGWASVRWRRLEIASAIHARVSKQALAAMLLIEIGACLLVVTLLAASVTTIGTFGIEDEDRMPIYGQALGILTATIIGAVLGVLLSLMGTRERHLFRYFKDR